MTQARTVGRRRRDEEPDGRELEVRLCVYCGDQALDGHLTCGRVTCDESAARRTQEREFRRNRR